MDTDAHTHIFLAWMMPEKCFYTFYEERCDVTSCSIHELPLEPQILDPQTIFTTLSPSKITITNEAPK